MLVGLWGRAAAVDRPVVEEAAAEAVEAVAVSDRVVDWIVGEVAGQADRLPDDVEPAVRAILGDPASRSALSDVVRVLVGAALSDPGESVVVDLGATLQPHLSQLDGTLDAFAVDDEIVEDVVEALEPVTLGSDAVAPLGEALASTERALRLAAVIGVLSAGMLFGITMLLAGDRRVSARALAARTFFGAAGFAVMLRAGAWALDPGAGGANAAPSLRRAIAVLARSNLHLPIVVAIVAAVAWVGLRRRRSRRPDAWVTGEVTVVPSTG
jgi:hypothetical protein